MNKKEYLRIVRKQIQFIFDRDEIEKELNQHLQDSILDLMEEGLTREEAELQAVAQMGDPMEVGKQLNQQHHPFLGYLLKASEATIYLLIVPTLLMLIYFGYNAIQLVTPTVVENSVEVIPLNLEVDIPTHDMKIDNICLSEDGKYYITFRLWNNFEYSRAGWSTSFHLENSEGRYADHDGYHSNGILGSNGYMSFTWPDDDLLYLISRDGKRIEIDLKEYIDEKN